MIDHLQAQLALGAYVLGALDGGERGELEEHLGRCEACRDELVSFAGLPGLMGRLTADEARHSGGKPSAALQASTIAAIRSERTAADRGVRRWRAAAGLGVAAAVAACTALILVLTTNDPSSVDAATVHQELTADRGASAHGSLALSGRPWGTQVQLVLTDLPRTGAFSVRTTDGAGHQSTAATWRATANGRAELTGATPSQMGDITRVDIITDTGVAVLSNR